MRSLNEVANKLVVFVFALVALALTACTDNDTLTEPLIEAETFEFVATLEQAGYMGGVLANHSEGIIPQTNDFVWPITSEYDYVGRWGASTDALHSLGVQMGFGGVIPGFGPFAIEFNIEWVNGTTKKPLDFYPFVVASMERYYFDSGSTERLDKILFTTKQIGPNRYRIEFQVPPTDSPRSWYFVSAVAGFTVRCNTEGVKSFLVRNVTYSGGGFDVNEYVGSSLFTSTCRRPLAYYSVVSG